MKYTEKTLSTDVSKFLQQKYPKVIFRFDIAADIRLSIGQATRSKRLQGGLKGYPDLFIAKPNKYYHGLYIELKTKSPFLKEASGWVTDFDSKKQSIRLNFKGFGKGKIAISGLTPVRSFEIEGTAVGNKPRWIESDEKGTLSLKGLSTGTVEINAR